MSLARGLSMEIKQIGKRGLRLNSITGWIKLALSDNPQRTIRCKQHRRQCC
jgi:hypothetical protein